MTEEYRIISERQADDMLVRIVGDSIVIDVSVSDEHTIVKLDPFKAQHMANSLLAMSKLLTVKLLMRGDRK